MMTKDAAIERAFNRLNLQAERDGESVEIYRIMYQYKALRDLPDHEFDQAYEDISRRLGFWRD